jgi:photosystem II stability/assembly factor-like uncharacterized protein
LSRKGASVAEPLSVVSRGGLFRTTDGGASWTELDAGESWARVSEHRGVQGRRPWYYSHLVADPVDPDGVWALNHVVALAS